MKPGTEKRAGREQESQGFWIVTWAMRHLERSLGDTGEVARRRGSERTDPGGEVLQMLVIGVS